MCTTLQGLDTTLHLMRLSFRGRPSTSGRDRVSLSPSGPSGLGMPLLARGLVQAGAAEASACTDSNEHFIWGAIMLCHAEPGSEQSLHRVQPLQRLSCSRLRTQALERQLARMEGSE